MEHTQQHPLILQLDMSGTPSRWIDFQTAAYYQAKNLIAWTPSDELYVIHGGTNRITQTQSTMELNTIIAIKGEIGSKHVFRTPSLTNKTLFRRDHNLCAYCGIEFTTAKLTRDHILPSSRQGKNVWMNVVTACAGCNRRKDDNTPEEAGMKLLYLPYVPSIYEHLILTNRNILQDQMDFLMTKVGKDSRLLAHNQLN
jgi:5-methylcytosine-specific restriction endonuclease McrA